MISIAFEQAGSTRTKPTIITPAITRFIRSVRERGPRPRAGLQEKPDDAFGPRNEYVGRRRMAMSGWGAG
jgi:hypothetical protein